MHKHNPYQEPMYGAGNSHTIDRSVRCGDRRHYFAWVVVFVFNMAVPLLFGWEETRDHGKVGLMVAALLLLALGCLICAADRRLATPLIAGSAMIGITQVFPLLQIVAGLLGMSVGRALGLGAHGRDAGPGRIGSEAGGFVVTLVTGGILMAVSAGSGMLIRLLTPSRWWPTALERSREFPAGPEKWTPPSAAEVNRIIGGACANEATD
jgi:hypothetical protein